MGLYVGVAAADGSVGMADRDIRMCNYVFMTFGNIGMALGIGMDRRRIDMCGCSVCMRSGIRMRNNCVYVWHILESSLSSSTDVLADTETQRLRWAHRHLGRITRSYGRKSASCL